MRSRSGFLICMVLSLALVHTACGYVYSDFEGNLNPWFLDGGTTGTISQTTTGVTSGAGAMVADSTAGNWQILVKSNAKSYRAWLSADQSTITADFTAFADDVPGGWMNVGMVINAQSNDDAGPQNNIGWRDLGQQALTLDGQPHTLSWPLDDTLRADIAKSDDAIQWFEIDLIANVADATPLTLYVDNVQVLTPDETVPTSYEVQIADWENDPEGWTPTGSETMSYSNTTGVTSGDYSLKVAFPGAGWNGITVDYLTNHPELVDLWRKGTKFKMDVTELASEWDGTFGWGEVTVVINAGGPDPDGPNGQWSVYAMALQGNFNPANGDNSFVFEWDYSSLLSQYDWDNLWWFQLLIISNTGVSDGTGAHAIYVDNLRIVVEDGPTLPNPADKATNVSPWVNLSWRPGASATSHEVFFGTDKAAVRDANSSDYADYPGLSYSDSPTVGYSPSETLDLETTYYWRVNEVNGTDVYGGPVWSFTTGNYLIVDDFERYDDACGRVYYTWLDSYGYSANEFCGLAAYSGNGSGSVIGNAAPPWAEQTIVHGGIQSMPYGYDTDMTYSEATAAVTEPNGLNVSGDWTEAGVKTLSLQFYGKADNDPALMYLMLEDGSGGNAIVTYDGSADDVKVEAWQEWRVPLSQFVGVDLTDVKKFSIGFGTRGNTTAAGGSGTVFIDDIRLYRPECILSERSPDFAKMDFLPAGAEPGDCRISFDEIEAILSKWLYEGQGVATANPGTNGLVGYWPLDEGTDTTANDASGQGHTGTLLGTPPAWVDGMAGYGKAVQFTGTGGDVIDTGTWNPSATTGKLTVAAWIKWDGLNNGYQGVVSKRDDWTSTDTMWSIELNNNTGDIGFARYDSFPDFGLNVPTPGVWLHVAVTFDGTDTTMYIDGQPVGTSDVFSFGPATTAHVVIGGIDSNGNNPFNGVIDDVRIYDRALSGNEVAFLADLTPGDGELYTAPAEDVYDPASRVIDFKDFAVLSSHLFETQMYPWK